jgi:uncharacterized protein
MPRPPTGRAHPTAVGRQWATGAQRRGVADVLVGRVMVLFPAGAALTALAGRATCEPMTEPPENQEPPDSLIPYDEIVQDSLRQVVRRVLQDVSIGGGLPGAHHFFIAFRTRFPGVDMPRHLLERYPEEMTVVLQHRYWDLLVSDEHFEVGLTFNQVPAKLSIPYRAISGFVDPAVNFALQFIVQMPELDEEPEVEPVVEGEPGSNVVSFDFKRKK